MKRFISIACLLFVAISLIGCSGSKKNANKTKMKEIPKWFLETPNDPNYIIAASSAISRDLQMAVNTATEEARVQIARELEIKISGLFKRFREEVGFREDAEFLTQSTDVSKSVVSTTLTGTKVRKKKIVQEGGGIRAYILMEMPLGPMNEALLNKIKEQKNMYTRFRASEGFKELEKEVEKYEKWKENSSY